VGKRAHEEQHTKKQEHHAYDHWWFDDIKG
jgi:hypothetical protein